MANKRYYWLKLKEDFFKSKEIKKLRTIAGGDTFVIIYLKIQLLSLKNEGKLFFDGIDDDFASELALEIDEDVENVRVTLNFLERCKLLEYIAEDEYYLPIIPEITGSESESAERVRKHRALQNNNKPLQCNADVTEMKQTGNVFVTTEKELEKDIELEKDTETEKEKRERTDYQQIADMYNETCVSFPKCTALSDKRKKAIKARLKTYSVDDFRKLFEKAEQSSFLKGGNNRNWSANFDWLIKDENMAKVLDGNYDERGNYNGNNSGTHKGTVAADAFSEGLI